MKVFIANLGSTSFKFRLFVMPAETVIAEGAVENIPSGDNLCRFAITAGSDTVRIDSEARDHGHAFAQCLQLLQRQGIDVTVGEAAVSQSTSPLAFGFKAVCGGKYKRVHRVDDDVISEMQRMAIVAPAHNPIYVSAMKQIRQQLPDVPLVAAFETDFHLTTPRKYRTYAVPVPWLEDFGVQRLGYHGASHRFIAERMQQLEPGCPRVISCHLGGSSSLCAIENGRSLGASMGLSPQSGLPQSNRCGDVDVFAIPLIARETGWSLDQIMVQLATGGGLLGLTRSTGDVKSLLDQAARDEPVANEVLAFYVAEIRRSMGDMLLRLGGADAIAFTGGIGERSPWIRQQVCDSLGDLGIAIDPSPNEQASAETPIHAASSRTRIWVVPTNEELIVARQTWQCLNPLAQPAADAKDAKDATDATAATNATSN